MEPSFFPAQRQLKAYSKIRDGDARGGEGDRNRGGLLQSESLALWQNATEPMDQNKTQKLPWHRTAHRSLLSQHPS